ncbi:MAG TPA: hypothetical protein VFU11_12430 [Solirubrobacterales bacterium]|nr:hypothetical protein [Solirubrobacterales bacterium]
MQAILVLCDAAQAVDGRLFVLGGGLSRVDRPDLPVTMSLAILVKVPWSRSEEVHELKVVLMTADGAQFKLGGNDVKAEWQFEAGRPPGSHPGADLNVPAAFNFSGISLPAGGFRWELFANGEQLATAPFRVGS